MGPGHVPFTARTSPVRFRRAGADFLATLTRTYFPLATLWQTRTFFGAAVVVVVAVVTVLVVLPLPGGGFAIAIDASSPAAKTARRIIFSFMQIKMPQRAKTCGLV